jgi:glycosyltransferase involved in cell wall biosynthesis
MKIAQIAPLAESCPPRFYGGTERIVSYLTEALVAKGHDVTLFASGDSKTSAELIPCSKIALRLDANVQDYIPYHMIMLDKVRRRAHEFDVLHFHIAVLQAPVIHEFANKTVTTLHGRLNIPDLIPFFEAFPDTPLASISYAQRRPMPASATWAGNVYHGLPADILGFEPSPRGGYLAFLGRISPEKRPDRAIEIAARAGLPLKMAAKIDKVDQGYWEGAIKPMIEAHPNVEFVGEISDQEKPSFLGNALALLFPIDWPEPFGLVMIESFACGTPVIAFAEGSVPEVVDEGVTGFVVRTIEEAVRAVGKIHGLDRAKVRTRFARRFTVDRMTNDYIAIYRTLARTYAEASRPSWINGHDSSDEAGLGVSSV